MPGQRRLPCGHPLDAADIIAFGGPGGAIECTICGKAVTTPPSDAVHWTHGKPFPCGHKIKDFDPATRSTPGAVTKCTKCGYEVEVPRWDPR